jgi:hypothetical protein
MATIESTTVVQFETDTVEQFKVDTSTQEFLALTRIATNFQRMVEALEDCQHGDGNSLCVETYNKVSDLLAELDTELL